MYHGWLNRINWCGPFCLALLMFSIAGSGGDAFAQDDVLPSEEAAPPAPSIQSFSPPRSTYQLPLFELGSQIQGFQNPGSTTIPTSVSLAAIEPLSFASSVVMPGYTYLGANSLPGYQGDGIKSGDYLVKFNMSSGVGYDSNILESHYNPLQTYLFFVSPTLDVIKDSGRSQQELFVSGTATAFNESSPDNYQDVYVSLRNTYALTPTSQVFAYAAVADGYERRISQNFQIPFNASTPVHEQVYLTSVGYNTQISNDVQAGFYVKASAENYDHIFSVSGTYQDQSYRNENDLIVYGWLNWDINSRISSTLSVQAFNSSFEERTLDFNQAEITDTITAAITSKLKLSVMAGVTGVDNYNNPAVSFGPLMEYNSQIAWNPTARLAFRVIGGYRDLGLDYIAGIEGGYGYYGAFDMSYLIWRNLSLQAGVAYEKRYQPGSFIPDKILQMRSVLTYEINSHTSVSLLAGQQDWNSPYPINTFNETLVEFSLNIRF